jgi:phosphate transport system substrate-binding protein
MGMRTHKATWLILFGITITLIVTACGISPQATQTGNLNGTITISGAFALYPMMTVWADEFHKINPGVEFDISAGGAGKGMTDTLTGAVDIGMVSRSVKPEEEAQGAFVVGVVKDAVFPVVNANNPVIADIMSKGILQATFSKIFISGEVKTWGEAVGKPEITDAIHIYTRSDAAGAADVWAQYLGGKGQADLQGIGVNGDPGLLAAVVNDPLGIGYNNLGYAFDQATGGLPSGAKVVPIDINGNNIADPDEILSTLADATAAVANGTYPSPPARVLNLVTKGKPSGLVQAFIVWILTDGQKLIPESGFIQLPPDLIAEALSNVK